MMTNQRNALTTVVSYPERGEGGNNRYRGNWSPKLIEDLIAQFGIQDLCDYMCGSNTTGDAARTMGIHSHTYDLHSGFDPLHCDIPERPSSFSGTRHTGISSNTRMSCIERQMCSSGMGMTRAAMTSPGSLPGKALSRR